ncbi:hypothetical protein Hypma_013566 [Hypsizygus marmoreus]|uniref:TERF2-interacting telomeric protein 1 Myb domain-containing protein n=1 Tax=Hypsizygus marmoreus TaxID=39966 RepID=A0A369JI47_HYPMA|nr:hypothetical protein Hypma_013566 [Hypsizygus marmoreus]
MSGRNPYTSDEESLLVKCIATYNPQSNGRSGNALYQKLVENADGKWKWSKTHTWQSWRAQYYKNQEYYDRRIRKYMRKHGISDEKPRWGLTQLKRAREDSGSTSGEDDEETVRAPKKQKSGVVKEEKRVMNEPKPVHRGRGEKQEGDKKDKQAERVEEEEDSSDSDYESETAQRLGPVGSDDYRAALSPDSDEHEDASSEEKTSQSDKVPSDVEVDEQLLVSNGADASNPDLSHILRTTTNAPSYELLYPDIQTLPVPHLESNRTAEPEPSVPGSYNGTSPLQRHTGANPQPKATTSKVQLSPSHKVTPSPPSASKRRRKRLDEKEDENIFGTPPPTPSPPQLDAVRTKHRLPRLVEGPFGTAFAGTRKSTVRDSDSSDEEEAKVPWPPVRKKGVSALSNGKGKKKETPKDASDRNLDDSIGKAALNGKAMVPPGHAAVRPVVRRPIQINAQASSSRTLPSPAPESAPPAGGTRLGKPSGRLMVNRKKAEAATKRPSSHEEQKSTFEVKPHGKRLQGTRSLNQEPGTVHTSSLSEPARTKSPPAALPTKKSSGLRHETRPMEYSMPRASWTPGDPFTAHQVPAASSRAQEKALPLNLFDRRHTIGGASENPLPARRIDLRAEISKRLHARSSLPLRSRTHSTATIHSTPNSHRSSVGTTISVHTRTSARTIKSDASTHRRASLLPIPVADEDRAKIDYLGMTAAIAMIAENFGFREESVWRMWEFFKNISKTEEFCRRYREKSERTEDAVLEEMEKDGWKTELFGEDPDESQLQSPHLPPQPQPPLEDLGHQVPSSSTRLFSSPSRPRSAKKRNLEVKPLSVDDDALSEYSPPFTSRAGQYVRLVKQGRKEEALSREGRRASGAGRLFSRARSMSMGDATPHMSGPDILVHSGAEWVRTEGVQPESESESEAEPEPEPEPVVRRDMELEDDERELEPEDDEPEMEPEADERKMEPEDEPKIKPEEEYVSAPEHPPAGDEASLVDEAQDDMPWTENEEMAFLSAHKGNADALREIEQRTDVDFMLRWTASRLAEFRERVVGGRSSGEYNT